MNAAVLRASVSGVASRVAVAPERRGGRRACAPSDGGVCHRRFNSRVAAKAGEDKGDGWPQWRSTPEPNSPFASMFDAASAMAGGNQPTMDPPRKAKKTRSKKAVPGKTYDSWLAKDDAGDASSIAITRDGCEDECDPAEEPDCVPSPYCSITFIDESEDDDGEGDFLPPMSDPATAAGVRAPPPTTAWPPWLEDTQATTHVSGPACDITATVEVCAGKACARNGLASDVMNSLRGNMPPGWTLTPGRKCMGMCKKACVVRVTGDVNQVVHTGVTSATAAISVLPGRSFSTMAGLSLDDYIPATMPPEEEGRKEPERAAPAMAAASGLFAAAAAAVDRGIDLDESAEGKGVDAAVKTREKKKRNSSVLLAARAASARVEDMGVAAYSRELQGKASNDKEFPFSY